MTKSPPRVLSPKVTAVTSLGHTFSSECRLLSPEDFSPVFKNPDFRVSNRYLLILAKMTEAQQSRLGVVVSKRNVRLAVQRNRMKRIFRESFRMRQEEFATIDFVFLAKANIDKLSSNEVRKTAETLLDQVKQQRLKRAKTGRE